MRTTCRFFLNPFLFFLVFTALIGAGQGDSTAHAEGADRIYYFNMNFDGMQGNLILVESNGQWGLVDTGHRYAQTIQDSDGRMIPTPESGQYSSRISMRNGKDVANYMINQMGITHLDFIVGTHSHSDHIGGVPEIATTAFRDASGQIRYLVDGNTTYFYKEYQHINDIEDDLVRYSDLSWHNQAYYYQATKTMQDQGANLVDVSKQQVVHGDPGNAYGDYIPFTMGNMTFRLYNVHEQTNTGNENVNSIVTVMTNGNYTVVNLSDIDTGNAAIDRTSAAIGKEFDAADVVVAGHHGYPGSNTKTMFDELQPHYVVISNGSEHGSWLYTDSDLAAAIPYAQGLFGTLFYSTALSPYAIVTDLSGDQVYIYNLESNGALTDAFYQVIKSTNKTGWVSWVNTGETLWSYLENGRPARNSWQRINGSMYHFDSTGIMETGWCDDGTGIRYLNSNGSLVTGWKEIDGRWYFFEDSCGYRLADVWERIDGRMYHFDSDGTIHTGWLEDEGGTRYCDADGMLVTGWKEIEGKWYFFESACGYRLADVWERIDGRMYHFDSDGTIHTGWLEDEGGTRYCDANGALVTGWKEIDGIWYYFEQECGYRLTNTRQEIDGILYCFDETGRPGTVEAERPEGEQQPTADSGAAAAVGWQQIDGSWYYFDTNGSACTGWQEIDGSWYYFDADGRMARDTEIDGYYVNTDGIWVA